MFNTLHDNFVCHIADAAAEVANNQKNDYLSMFSKYDDINWEAYSMSRPWLSEQKTDCDLRRNRDK